MAYVRKARNQWDIETNYGYGWETESSYPTTISILHYNNKLIFSSQSVMVILTYYLFSIPLS